MIVGASTACFYPAETEKALVRLGKLGFDTAEVFFNTYSEISDSFCSELLGISNNYGIKICSVHPFTAFAESYLLFSAYKRRFADTIELYKKYFQYAARLGAGILVIHGMKGPGSISHEEYFERFGVLSEEGRKFGITVAQENVVKHFSQSPASLAEMKSYLGDNFNMVLDVKQAVRAGYSPFDFADSLGGSIVHVHLSDNDDFHDCLPPGKGNFDFKKLFDELKDSGYNGKYIIELYSSNFSDDGEILKSKEYLGKFE